jgi:hypothetical protein
MLNRCKWLADVAKLHFSFHLSQDPQDARIVDDSWPAMDGTRVIAAWGSSPSMAYHGLTNRVFSQVLRDGSGP